MGYLLVCIGGTFGSITRYSVGRKIIKHTKTIFPLATFFINISGAFLLGVLSSFTIGGNLYMLLTDGFLGAFTTFSTFMYEGFNLWQQNERLNAVTYITISIFLGILGFALGEFIAGLL
jgi:fluoride exporter